MRRIIYSLLSLVCIANMLSCSDSDLDLVNYEGGVKQDLMWADKSKPVTLNDFSPKEGAAQTKLIITGDNFGNDTSRISVTIGGRKAKIVGADGKQIYCIVPARAFSGEIAVQVADKAGDTLRTAAFDSIFHYKTKWVVSTLIRKVDQYGNTMGNISGPFADASFMTGAYMQYLYKEGQYDQLIIGGWQSGIHCCDFNTGRFDLLTPYQHNTMQSFCMSEDEDTLFMPDDNHLEVGYQLPNIYYSLRSENFSRVYPYHNGPCSYGVTEHPGDHTKFYTTWKHGGVWKVDGIYHPETNTYEDKLEFEITGFLLAAYADPAHLIMHPSGKYMYIVSNNSAAILKSVYNPATKEFMTPTVICGSPQEVGYVEGTGSASRTHGWILQGVFVKNQDYVRAGKEDVYDFYFVDPWNACVRKLTPEGSTSLFAGRANSNRDGKYWGYADGDPIKEARFYQPQGIAYDERNHIFYVAEWDNHALRMISEQ